MTTAREQARQSAHSLFADHGNPYRGPAALADAASDVWEPLARQAKSALMDASCLVPSHHPDLDGIMNALNALREALDG